MSLATVFLYLGIGAAKATTMIPLTMDQLVDASDHVVRAKVVEVWTEPNPDTGFVWTNAQIEVLTVLKGDKTLDALVLEQPGGAWGARESEADGSARFSVGEEGYFFVEELKSGKLVTTGMHQGKFNIIMDPHSRKHIALRFNLHVSRPFDHRFIPLPKDPSKRVNTDSFESKVKQRVEMGWDGKSIPGTPDARLHKINRLQTEVTK